MSKGKYGLVCIAHPDDETIFFGGLLQQRAARSRMPWKAICVTDGNADGQGELRKKQFRKACKALGVDNFEWWGFQDRYEQRLPVDEIARRLSALPVPHEIFTHGPIGEYGHPHHQDVSYAVHQAFEGHPRLYASAYNAYPELKITLSEKEFEVKSKILASIYGTETRRFLNLLPSTSSEGFLRLDPAEIRALYDFFAHGKPLRTRSLKAYRWLRPYIEENAAIKRPF